MIKKACAVLFPPLTVLFVSDRKADFYVNLACTACCYVPGSLHALYVVCRG